MDMTKVICPRCWKRPVGKVAYDPGALSRADNRTHICGYCGNEEGMLQFQQQPISKPAEWPVATPLADQFEAAATK